MTYIAKISAFCQPHAPRVSHCWGYDIQWYGFRRGTDNGVTFDFNASARTRDFCVFAHGTFIKKEVVVCSQARV